MRVPTDGASERSAPLRFGALVLLGLLLTALAPAPRVRADDDDWLGPDKALHFGLSAALAAGGYGVAALVWDERWARATAGGALALFAGATKELLDLAGLGDPSWRDFTWDVIGAATGVLLGLGIDLIVSALEASPPAPGPTAAPPR